jgi:hypothetical protein
MRPIVSYGASKKEIEAYHEARKQWEPEQGRPGDFLPSSGMCSSPHRRPVKPKWRATPTEENKRPDGNGSAVQVREQEKRSWKVNGEILWIEKPRVLETVNSIAAKV